MLHLDSALAYLVVLTAVGFIARPLLYRLIGQKAPSSACHPDADNSCRGGCANCPANQKKRL